LVNWQTDKGGEKEIAKKIECDVCEKDVREENTYELKLRNPITRMTKSVDICHICAKDKGIVDLLAKFSWKVWNKNTSTWVKPDN